jgi:carboxypeptidase Taq
LNEAFAAGDFRTLSRWLGEHVYRHGRRYTAAAIVERATGSAPDPSALIESLSQRYREHDAGGNAA